ncbi:hypothetical protein BZA05DRAFT_456911 [Tricharina praecox]|uniref:uncharacterized protein n=1 Tax=Tricharina praecox TaxID=43433 RepID=UPI0022207FE7|nr:uncharacterized protein BZA05DRAFT_456911 [Tricharina praecox]KAI5858089.1 hypothetical protein BZA05DRAFT_456911 [Tricharina praecox]
MNEEELRMLKAALGSVVETQEEDCAPPVGQIEQVTTDPVEGDPEVVELGEEDLNSLLAQLQQPQDGEPDHPLSPSVPTGETEQFSGADELRLDPSVLEEIARALRGGDAVGATSAPGGAKEDSSEHQLINALQKAFKEDGHSNNHNVSSDSTPTGQSPEPQAQGNATLSMLLQRQEQVGLLISNEMYRQQNGDTRGESYSPEIGEEDASMQMGDYDDASKHAERERIREENRERKKRWREVNQDRNKDNDLRCRVTKRAARLFGLGSSATKTAWVAAEFNKRKQKREQKEKTKGGDGLNLSSVFASSQPHAFAGSGDHSGVIRGCGDEITMESLVELLAKAPPELVAELHQVANDITGTQLPLGRSRMGQQSRNPTSSQIPPASSYQQQPSYTPHVHSPPPPPPPTMHGRSFDTAPGSVPAPLPQPEPEPAVTTLEGVLQGLVAGGEVPEGFDLLLAELAAEPEKSTPEVEQEAQPEPQPQPEPRLQTQPMTQLQSQKVPQAQTEEITQHQPMTQLQSQQVPKAQTKEIAQPQPESRLESQTGHQSQFTPEPVPTELQSEAVPKPESSGEPSSIVTESTPATSEPPSLVETRQASVAPEPTLLAENPGPPEVPGSAPILGAVESSATQESTLQAETTGSRAGSPEETGGELADVNVDELLAALAAAGEDNDEHAGILEEILNGYGMEEHSISDEFVADTAVVDEPLADDESIADDGVDVEALLGELAASEESNGKLAASEENEDEMTEEALERIIKECGFDPTSVALGTLTDEQLMNLDAILTNVTGEGAKQSEQNEQIEDLSPEITENMSVDDIDALLQKLSSESEGPSVNIAPLEQPFENRVFTQTPQEVAAPSSARDNFGGYTNENLRAILTVVLGGIGIPLVPARQEMPRSLKRPSSASYVPPPPAKRPRGPSPNVVAPSAVNQLQGIVQSSANIIRPSPTPTPLSPAYVASFGNTEDMNRRLMAMKPPPYRPGGGTPRSTHSASSAPIPSPLPLIPLPARPKSGEDEKRIKAMGFPPLLAGVKRKAE